MLPSGLIFLGTATISALVAILGLVALAFWFIVRIRHKRIWIPTLRLLKVEQRQFPKITLEKPPLISILFFTVTLLTLLFFFYETNGKHSSSIFT